MLLNNLFLPHSHQASSKKNSEYSSQSTNNSNCTSISSHATFYRDRGYISRSRGHSKFIIDGPKNETDLEREVRIGQQQVYNDLLDIDNETSEEEEDEEEEEIVNNYAEDNQREEGDNLLDNSQVGSSSRYNNYPRSSKSQYKKDRRADIDTPQIKPDSQNSRNTLKSSKKNSSKLITSDVTTAIIHALRNC